jgi:hypothetical protein
VSHEPVGPSSDSATRARHCVGHCSASHSLHRHHPGRHITPRLLPHLSTARASACIRKGVTLAIPARMRRIPCHPGQPRQGGQCVPTACPEAGREPRPTRHPHALDLRTLGDHGMADRGRHGPEEGHHAVRTAAAPSTAAVRLPTPTAALPAPAAQPATPAVRTTARLDTSVRHPASRAIPAPAVVRRPRRCNASSTAVAERPPTKIKAQIPGFVPADLGLDESVAQDPYRLGCRMLRVVRA